jgi:flagellar protein FliO/FliZ
MSLTTPTAIVALLAVLALIGLAAHAVRAFCPRRHGPSPGTLRIQDVLALDGRRRIYLIACADRRVLVMTGGGSDVVLGWLPPEEVP